MNEGLKDFQSGPTLTLDPFGGQAAAPEPEKTPEPEEITEQEETSEPEEPAEEDPPAKAKKSKK